MKYLKFSLPLVLILILTNCTKEVITIKDYSYQVPKYINDGISVGHIDQSALKANVINELTQELVEGTIHNVHSVLIYKDQKLVYEKYLCGKDEKHGKKLGAVDHGIPTLHDTRSISKSIVSACIGIAIREGILSGVNEPIINFFPDICKDVSSGNLKSKITIEDLLTMTSGLTWNEIGNYDQWFNDETKMDLSFNPVKFILKKNMEAQPGLKWNYSGGNTQLLAEIICRKSGKNIDQFANEYIFAPLGISKNEWVCLTMKNIPAAASGLRLTSRDLLKFGLLYLNSGTINRTQVIDSTWIEKSISPRVQRPDLTSLNISNGDYGYQFWTYHYTLRKKNLKIIEAKGNGGQSIFICKDLNLVVVVTAGNYGEAQYNNIPEKILREFVLPSII